MNLLTRVFVIAGLLVNALPSLLSADDTTSAQLRHASGEHFQAGLDAAKHEDWPTVIREFSEVIASRSDAASVCAAHVNRGRAKFMSGDLDGSLADFNSALSADPKSADALSWRAAYWDKKGDSPKAIEDATLAIKLDPKWVSAYVRRAISLGSQKQYLRASDDYSTALSLDPTNLAALVGRALAREKIGDLKGAITDMETALRIEPTIARGNAILDRLKGKAKKPNQSPEPTAMSVTPRADARVAPAIAVAHL